MKTDNKYTGFEVAIVGIACRFPGANDWRTFWDNLINEKESIKKLSDEELIKSGIDIDTINQDNYVKVAPDIRGKNFFDASFFNYTPEEGLILGPQNRLFHECVWEAFEDSGYVPENIEGLVGIYGSSSDDMNWKVFAKLSNMDQRIPNFILKHLSDKDFLPTMVSYKMNLFGLSVNMTSACSSSLVGVHMASRALVFGEVNMAVVGGACISTDPVQGYFYEDGAVYSKDGHCRSFDKDATGTVAGEGVGVIVLKRLSDAIKDDDHIYSIIKGTSVNNDGARKVGFTAPSVSGQKNCIKSAQIVAKVKPETVDYIEAHGTATKLGDSIEIDALNQAFSSVDTQIPLGSVKSNIGHLDTVAGLAAIIKTALSLKYKKLPASLNFKEPNPSINFKDGPFYVNNKTVEFFSKDSTPLRAGVSAFGVGGTNAHAILEEPPIILENNYTESVYKLIPLSAKTQDSLIEYKEKLKQFLNSNDQNNLSDMAYTFQVGRKNFSYRQALFFETKEELLKLLDLDTSINRAKEITNCIFMFSGQGSQYINMGKQLYENNFLFKEELDRGFKLLRDYSGIEFKDIIFPGKECKYDISETRYTQPLIFIIEYALAKLIQSYGITPKAMIGHSLGEYTAAVLSGVFSYEDALKLLYKRGQLIHSLPSGKMISVLTTYDKIEKYIQTDEVSLAVVNSEKQFVLSGTIEAIESLEEKLKLADIPCIKLKTSHAFHSSMLTAILDTFRNEFTSLVLNKPNIPFVSNLTGEYISIEEATSADYWVSHMRNTVLFENGIKRLLKDFPKECYLEVGPGRTLTSLFKQNIQNKDNYAISLLDKNNNNEMKYFLNQLGVLWSKGLSVNWENLHQSKRKKIPLPTYSFKKDSYASEVDLEKQIMSFIDRGNIRNSNIDEWVYRPYWRSSYWLHKKRKTHSDKAIVFADKKGLSDVLIDMLKKNKTSITIVFPGEEFTNENWVYTINPDNENDFRKLFKSLENDEKFSKIYHTWTYNFTTDKENISSEAEYRSIGYESIIKIFQNGHMRFKEDECEFITITNNLFPADSKKIIPEKATILGVTRVIPLEFNHIKCKTIDIDGLDKKNISGLLKELSYESNDNEIVIKRGERYVEDFERINFKFNKDIKTIKRNGVYLITGASGGVGKLLAHYLSSKYQANLVLLSRKKIKDELFLDSLRKNGSQIFYIESDVSDENKLREGLRLAENEIGQINGVIHAAGVGDKAGIILRRRHEEESAIFAAKVTGCLALYSQFENRKLDFFLNFSSQNVVLPNIGQSGYIASNIFLDYFSIKNNQTFPIVSVAWDTIKGIGMAVDYLEKLDKNHKEAIERNALNSEEVIKVFERVLYINLSFQIVSPTNLKEKIKSLAIDKSESAPKSMFDSLSTINTEIRRERPILKEEYVAPNSDVEVTLTGLLEKLLAITPIGMNDDFFELGIDSIKIVTLSNQISKEYEVDFPLNLFYEHTSITSLSREVEKIISKSAYTKEIII